MVYTMTGPDILDYTDIHGIEMDKYDHASTVPTDIVQNLETKLRKRLLHLEFDITTLISRMQHKNADNKKKHESKKRKRHLLSSIILDDNVDMFKIYTFSCNNITIKNTDEMMIQKTFI